MPKPSDLSEEFVRRGHHVEVVTGFPNYPAGRLYPSYRLRWRQVDVIDNVPVTRMWVWPYHGTSTLGRIVNYGTAVLGTIAGAFFTGPCDVIYTWHPPLTIGVAAAVVSAIKRAPLIYDVQDIWPESAVWAGMISSPLLIRLFHAIERFVYWRATHILVVTDGAKANLVAKGVDPERISVMAHWIDDELFERDDRVEPLRARYHLGNQFIVMFAGNLGVVQGLETVLSAAELIRDKPIVIVIVGQGSDKPRLIEIARTRKLTNVVFCDHLPMSEMPAWFRAADALLVHLKDSTMSELAMPTKTLAYLAAGKPIVMATHGAAADLIVRADAGVAIASGDPDLLARTLEALAARPAAELARMGGNGRRYFLTHFAKHRVMSDYETLFLSHANHQKPSTSDLGSLKGQG